MANELFKISQMRLRIDVKIIRDSGGGISSATLPVTVSFNKTFADIRSIQVTPNSPASARIAVIDFVDVPNPTSFDVYIFNDSGTQVSCPFTWSAEGIQGA